MRITIAYTPHPGQQLFHNSAARHRVLAHGARWGKDRGCIAESIRLNVELSQLPRPGLVPRVHGWFVTPNYPLAQQLWRELKVFTPPEVLAKPPLEKDHRLEWRSGVVVEVKSADDPHGLVAVGLDYVVLVEAGLLPEAAWNMALRPRLASPQRAGLAIFNGTPKGRNWYHRIYLQGLDPQQPDWESWNFPTAATIAPDGTLQRHPYGNPHVALAELEQARRDMPERWFRQEFLAEFISGEGAVFRDVRQRVAPPPATPKAPLIAGADLARRRDFTVFVIFDAQGRMLAMRRLHALPYRQQSEAFCTLLAEYEVKTAVVESNGPGDGFIEMLEQALHDRSIRCRVQPFETTGASKRQLIDTLVLAFERGAITLLDDPVLLNELEAYQAEETGGGHEKFGAPSGGYDDCVMAAALAFTQIAGATRKHALPTGFLTFTPGHDGRPLEAGDDHPSEAEEHVGYHEGRSGGDENPFVF
ncbi:MAG: hypothetical protein ABSD48_21040 [Armatimonadota bacterium]